MSLPPTPVPGAAPVASTLPMTPVPTAAASALPVTPAPGAPLAPPLAQGTIPVVAPLVPTNMEVVGEVMSAPPTNEGMSYWEPTDGGDDGDDEFPVTAAPTKPPKAPKPTKPPSGGGGPGTKPSGGGGGKPTKPPKGTTSATAPPAPAGGPSTDGGGGKGAVNVNILPGMGNGTTHALHKMYKGRPFPAQGGVLASFNIMFHQGFEWGCRGKIGGFVVGTGSASGGKHSSTAASYRMCWNSGGGAFAYVYVPSGTQSRQPPGPLQKSWQFGQLIWEREFARVFTAGKYSRVEMGIRLNTPGKSDGVMMLRVDGRQHTMNGIVWRTGNQPVTFFGLGIFHGGPCKATKRSNITITDMSFKPW